ncbi:MAG: transcription termination factor Rho [Acidimicrobiales bacterium]|nr:transcription termination factor Rho [Acidimicrobiales bacterium]
METAEMRRSTLQRKDREELTLIATTLGKKPSSRARKGEIIELILDLAAGGDGSSAGDASPDEASEPASTDNADERAEADDSDDSDSDDGNDESDDSDDGDTGSDSADGDKKSDGGSNGRGEAGGKDGGNAESGNRKRRRRGRERDNNKDSDEKWDGEPIPVAGYLELRNEGYGFLRVDGALPSKDDAYVPVKMVRQFGLRKGDHLAGTSRPANRNEKNPAMIEIQSINGDEPSGEVDRIDFDALPVVYPSEPIVLAGEQEPADPTGAVIDILTPIGKGQRVLLAGPPKSGKTTVLQHVIRSIETNHEDIELLVLLLDERPEDITEMTRWTERGDVVAASFERPAEEQVTIAEMVIERAKRMVESGKDVMVVVDGATRLARAYAQEVGGGRSGVAVDATTVHPAKRFLGAGRKLEGGGSLTMIATITVDTDSSIDGTIYEELAPTANCEIRLSRAAAVRRVFPAVDIAASATIHEESLRDDDALATVEELRRELASIADDPATEESADLQALLTKIADRVVKL